MLSTIPRCRLEPAAFDRPFNDAAFLHDMHERLVDEENVNRVLTNMASDLRRLLPELRGVE